MTTYAALKADIIAWTARDDIVDAQAEAFIRIAEPEIGRLVRVLEQETDDTLTCSSPDYTAALPDGYLGFKHVFVVGASDPKTQYMPPDLFHEMRQSPQDGFHSRGTTLLYTIEAGKVKVDQPVGASDPIVLDVCYIKKFEALSGSNTTNWLLTNQYDIYLWACLREAWDFIDETEMVAKYQGRFDRAVGQLDKQEVKKRQPSGPLVARPPTAVV